MRGVLLTCVVTDPNTAAAEPGVSHTLQINVNGFATTGIVPYNRGVFSGAGFAGTGPTDLPIAPSSDGNKSTSAPAASGRATDDLATVTGSSAASSPKTRVLDQLTFC